MYGVSNQYKSAMHQRVQEHKVHGSIGNVQFVDEDILYGSMTITNQCSGNEELAIGQVFIGELKATFLDKVNIPRGSWQGKEITVVFSLLLDNDTWEDVPVGVFTVSEAMHGISGVDVVAYDHMTKLDKDCGVRFTSASPYEMLTYACIECGVELGNTQEEIEALPNGNIYTTQYPESDIETWRDMVSWVAQTLGCFATAGRDGKIYLKVYNQYVVDTIDKRHRHKGATFSDFQTRYTGMSVVNIDEQTTSYYALEVDDGLTYNLGSNPFLQDGNIDQKRQNVLNALAVINYTPFKSDMIGNIAYDLGDVLRFTDGAADDSLCCITKYVYTHHRGYSIVGVGKNPDTANGKSKTDKNIAGLVNKMNADEFRTDVVVNGKEIEVDDGDYTRIARASIVSQANAQIKVDIEILLTVELTDEKDVAIGEITYVLDSTTIDRHPIETWIDGDHILRLMYPLQLTDAGFHIFDVFMRMTDGSAYIPEYGLIEVFTGKGMAATQGFNGLLEIEEEAPAFTIPQVRFANDAIDDVVINLQAPEAIRISDTASAFSIPQVTLDRNVTENIRLVRQLNQSARVTEDGTVRVTEDGDVRYTEAEKEEE